MLINAIEDRLWDLERAPWCRSGMELYLVELRLIAYDTGERILSPAVLLEAIERVPLRSLYYHVHETRRRTEKHSDDFSLWLETVVLGRLAGDKNSGDRLLFFEP